MNRNTRKFLLMIPVIAVFLLTACKKNWDQRDMVTDQNLNVNLMQQIQANPNLSTFAGYIAKVGYDKLLTSTKTYTLYVPTNTALQGLDPAITGDTAQLRKFVANHIVNQAYLTGNIQGASVKLHNLNGKNLTFTPTTIEEASITGANQYVKNGVLHVIDKPLIVKLNISEYIRSLTTVGQLHKAYILRQDSTFIDTSKATVASIDPKTGKPILVAGTGLVNINKYFNRVASLDKEDSLYTYFVLSDNAYNTERNKVSKYFTTVTNSTDTTMNILAAFNVLKDVAVRGVYKLADLPAKLTSVNGVNIPIDKSAIVQSYTASNGIVYVMNSMSFALSDKITPIIIQGEKPSFFSRTDQTSKIQIRLRNDPNNPGVQYRDMLVAGSGLTAQFIAAYKLSNLYTCQYKVVLKAVNDTSYTHVPAPGNISQRITFGQITSIAPDPVSGTLVPVTAVNFAYQNIPPYNYTEMSYPTATAGTITAGSTINVTSGNLTVTKYSSVNMYVQGANSTTANANDILIDYIKLIPILQ